MAVVPDIFTVFPTGSLADQTLVAGKAGYRYRIVDWYLGIGSGTSDVVLYWGATFATGRAAVAGKGTSATVPHSFSPRSLISGTTATNIANFVPWPAELLNAWEGESLGLYFPAAGTWTAASYVTYQKIPVTPSGI